MKSYFVELTGINESRVNKEEINTKNLASNEAIIKMEYSMISAGTELSRAFALKKGFKYPVRPGYCGTGIIVSAGESLNLSKGDKVFVNSPHASLVRASDGNDVQGPTIFKLPNEIDSKEATAINLLLVALQGVNLTNVKMSDTVGVFGLGNIGILTALMYKKLGCKVIGLDPVKQRCKLAKKMGVDYTIDAVNQKEEINKLTNNRGLDIAIDASGIAPVIINCVDCTKAYGQVLLLGSPRQSYETDIMPLLSMIHMKNLTVLGGFNKTASKYPTDGSDNSVYKNFNRCVDLIMSKDIDISKLITKVIDPKDCQQAYYDLMYNKNKVNCIVYDWTKY